MKKLKILIAEDDDLSSQLIALVLEQFKCETIKADTGEKAVVIMQSNPDIDLIFMDIKMPKLNGYEATRLIRKFNSNVIIIAQTAYALEGDKEKSIEAGCNEYISKPINKNELEGLVKKYFEKTTQLQ